VLCCAVSCRSPAPSTAHPPYPSPLPGAPPERGPGVRAYFRTAPGRGPLRAEVRDLGRCKNGRALVCAGRQEVRTILIWMPAASARRFLLVEPRVLLSPSEMWFTPIEMTSGLRPAETGAPSHILLSCCSLPYFEHPALVTTRHESLGSASAL
jgi:hypothetical protein